MITKYSVLSIFEISVYKELGVAFKTLLEEIAKDAEKYLSDPLFFESFKKYVSGYSGLNMVSWADSIRNIQPPRYDIYEESYLK